MSGPKIDYAELERQRQAELERQRQAALAAERARQARLRAIQEATDRCNAVTSKIDKLIKTIRNESAELTRTVGSEKGMELTVGEFQKTKEECLRRLERLRPGSLPAEPADMHKLAQRLEGEVREIEGKYKGESKEALSRMKDHVAALGKQKELSSFSSKLRQTAEETAALCAEFSFTLHVEELDIEEEELTEDVMELFETAMEDIRALSASDSITHADKKELMDLANNIMRSTEKGEKALHTAITEFNYAKVRILRHRTAFEELYREYIAEYTVYLNVLNTFRTNKIPVNPKKRVQFVSAEALQKEIATISRLCKEANEQNYIKQQINEVMAMFGYSLCEDVVLDTNPKVRHYLCRGAEGKSAIHVSVSDTNQLMMEIVGTGTQATSGQKGVNAVRVNSADLSEAEVSELLEQQGQFCHLHPQITEELRRRGVLLRTKLHQAPNALSCKKILNIVSAEEAADLMVADEEDVLNTVYTRRHSGEAAAANTMALK